MVNRGWLVLPDGYQLPIALKQALPEARSSMIEGSMRREALALKTLDGLAGVPRLYGMTQTGSGLGLVMSFSPGRSLASLRGDMSARSYLTVLMYACGTLLKMHEKGVTHLNLRDEHILIDVSEDGKMRSFTIIAFTRAERDCGQWKMMHDAEIVRSMVSSVYDEVVSKPQAERYINHERMDKIVHGNMTVGQIMMELCSILHGHPVDVPCKYRP
uniref:Protein kinase domain-containing protein n=1 Tax=Scylla olivacea TaxID=85551 RepID=A0A0P4WWD6_SCYOL